MLPATVDHLYEFSIRSCGVASYDLIRNGGRGAVTAVFDSSFYFDVGGALACVVRADVPDGPMHVIVDAPTSLGWKSAGLEVSSTVMVTENYMKVGRAISFDASSMHVWRPAAHRSSWTTTSLTYGIQVLKQIARSRLPVKSFTTLSGQEFHAPAMVRSLAALCNDRFVLETAEVQLKDLSALVGLGQGLTPSGDDFLGGVMIALRAAGFDEACAVVWSVIGPVAAKNTNRISFEHLSHASQGQSIEPLDRLARATVDGRIEEISALADDVDRVGHTSGWDSVAGMICGFESVAKAMRAG